MSEFSRHDPGQLPPLNALRVFDAVARFRSVRAAASALHVTPSAISQQLKVLEEWLEQPLFQRSKDGLSLTDTGHRYLPYIQRAFTTLHTGTRDLSKRLRTNALAIGSMTSFMSRWLVPRLPRFQKENPDVELWVASGSTFASSDPRTTHDHFVTLERSFVDYVNPLDLSIRHGPPGDPGKESIQLLRDYILPVCSPDLIATTPLEDISDLEHHRLLDDSIVESWDNWFEFAGQKPKTIRRGTMFSHCHDLIEAACRGHGVGLARGVLVYDLILEGKLVVPLKPRMPSCLVYQMLIEPSKAENRNVEAFRDWIIGEASEIPEQEGIYIPYGEAGLDDISD